MKKIMIVDDARFIQKVTSAMLSDQYETVCASSGQEALALYEREKPDLILTDLIMPGMSGLDLQKALQNRYHEQIPIVFMSADENEESEIQGLESGALDYIRKPFKAEILLRRVGNILRNVERIRGLKMVAETDPMTGLLNKAHAQKVIGQMCARASGTLMMVDLDSFKLVNDIYGHGMGDRVLIRFAEIIRSVIRTSDVAGRMGGDEFIVFCQDIKDEAVIAGKTRQINELIIASAREFMGEDMSIPLGASVGAVLVPDEGTDFALLYGKADKALYEVKQNGKHGCAFFHGEDAQPEKEKTTAATIENARMILEERGRQKGAYELGLENFRSVYRFLIRSIENYHRPVELVLFTLSSSAGEEAPPEETVTRFGENLGSSLRRSDVYTKIGRSQYMVLLPEMGEEENQAIIMNRVLGKWRDSGYAEGVGVSYESMILRE